MAAALDYRCALKILAGAAAYDDDDDDDDVLLQGREGCVTVRNCSRVSCLGCSTVVLILNREEGRKREEDSSLT